MSALLLSLWIALLGADRLDLAGGAAGVVVTPFLLLTPLLVVAQGWDRIRNDTRLELAPGAIRYAALLAALLCLVAGSVFVSLDPQTSAARAMLVVIQAIGSLAVALHLQQDPRSAKALQRGAAIGIVLFLLLDLLAVTSFFGVLPSALEIGPASLNLESYGYAGIIPRLSGTVMDPNRAGLMLVFYAVLSKRWRWVALALLPLTLSRSAFLAACAVGAVAALRRGVAARGVPRRAILATVVVLALAIVAIGGSSGAYEAAGRAITPFSERFTVNDEGSAGEHQSLLLRGIQEGTRTPERAVLGLGWGASYVVLQDVFPGNRYGNFHSLYATAFVEAGIFALILMAVLLLWPLRFDGPWRSLVAALAIFSLFYQATAEPAFWFVLAMAWTGVPVARHDPSVHMVNA